MRKLARVIPFRGVRYNQEKLPDLRQVVSPPYDIISPAEQERYHKRHPQNAIHLDYGLEEPGDDGGGNRYTRAAESLNRWLEDQILKPESSPAIYFLREEFMGSNGKTQIREGFIAALRLADFSQGIVLPHEETASGPKQDRLRLMEATEANLSPIFCLYSDPGDSIASWLRSAAREAPDVDITDDAGTRHTMWVVDDEQTASRVTEFLSDKNLLIADGHHRYETALAYRDARRAQEGGDGEQPYDYLMVYLSNMEASSQSVLPIHRLVFGLPARTLAELPGLLEKDFEVKEIAGPRGSEAQEVLERMDQAAGDRNVFCMFLPGVNRFFTLVSRSPRPVLDPAATGHSRAWCSLDVAVLDRLILGNILDINSSIAGSSAKVCYEERTENALRQAPDLDAVFFVKPTSMPEIKAVAEAGEKMPQKSTYFHPKPLTGLVFRCFRF